MNPKKKLLVMCSVCAASVAFIAWLTANEPVNAQSRKEPQSKKESQGGSEAKRIKIRPRSFESKLWDFLQSVHYHNWAPAANQGLEMYPGKSPHGSFLLMFVNRMAASNPKAPPYGSIIVKENFGKDKKKLLAVTVMYRVKGYDPEHNDWYWIKYDANGTVARTSPATGSKPISGKFKACIDCHAGAKGGDFYFTNDMK